MCIRDSPNTASATVFPSRAACTAAATPPEVPPYTQRSVSITGAAIACATTARRNTRRHLARGCIVRGNCYECAPAAIAFLEARAFGQSKRPAAKGTRKAGCGKTAHPVDKGWKADGHWLCLSSCRFPPLYATSSYSGALTPGMPRRTHFFGQAKNQSRQLRHAG